MIDVCLVMPVYSVPTLANSTIQSVMDEGNIIWAGGVVRLKASKSIKIPKNGELKI